MLKKLFSGLLGGGDAKVAAAAGLWFGFPPLASYLVYASLFGGALTLLMLQFRQWRFDGGRPILFVFLDRNGAPETGRRWLLLNGVEQLHMLYFICTVWSYLYR